MPDPVQTKTRLIVIQATPFCNVNCRYGYLPLERIMRLRERVKGGIADEVRLAVTAWSTRSNNGTDDDDDDIDWDKTQ